MTPLAVILVVLLACHASQASICPQEVHEVCNNDIFEFRCTCAISLAPDPAREQSCNNVVNPNDEDFAAASVTFNLDESASHHEEFPETRFRDAVANAVRVDKSQIIILRVKCTEEDTELVVQFVIKKKDRANELPFTKDDLIDASSIVSRMKNVGHLSQVADLDVGKIEEVDQLVPIEGVGDNVTLALIALGVALIIVFSCALGIFKVLRASRYSDIEDHEP